MADLPHQLRDVPQRRRRGRRAARRASSRPTCGTTTATHMYEAMLTGPQSMPVFNDANITPEEKRDIIALHRRARGGASPGGLDLGAPRPGQRGPLGWVVGTGPAHRRSGLDRGEVLVSNHDHGATRPATDDSLALRERRDRCPSGSRTRATRSTTHRIGRQRPEGRTSSAERQVVALFGLSVLAHARLPRRVLRGPPPSARLPESMRPLSNLAARARPRRWRSSASASAPSTGPRP